MTRSSFEEERDSAIESSNLPCFLLAVALRCCYKLLLGFSCPSNFMRAHRASTLLVIDLLLL